MTPNLAEAEGLLHGRADEAVEASSGARGRAEAAAGELVAAGARAAVVTAAAAGAAVAAEGRVTWLAAPRVEVRNPIGAGDVFTAALAAALETGHDVLTAARHGVAAAAAGVEAPLAGDLDPAQDGRTAVTGARPLCCKGTRPLCTATVPIYHSRGLAPFGGWLRVVASPTGGFVPPLDSPPGPA